MTEETPNGHPQVEPFTIAPARSPKDMEDAVALFSAYTEWIGLDLSFQNYAEELASLPGKYAPPAGELLLARDDHGDAIACVALRPLGDSSEDLCEMKRLYVDPRGRGLGLGRRLIRAIIGEARQRGYREMRLDSLPKMQGAIALYKQEGFEPIEDYYGNPLDGAAFFAKRIHGTK